MTNRRRTWKSDYDKGQKMYHFLLRRIQISAIAVKRHYWTQGDGPNYSKNMLMVGFGTVICAAVGLVYGRWKFDRELEET